MLSSKIRWLLIGLLILSTGLYLVGVSAERSSGESQETPAVQVATPVEGAGRSALAVTALPAEGETGHNEASETTSTLPATALPAEGETGHSEVSELSSAAQPETGHSETMLGINLESPAFMVANVVLAILLIGLLLRFQRPALPIIVVFALAATLLDILEVITQINRSNTGIAVIALLVTLMHIALAICAVFAWTRSRAQHPHLNA